MAAHLRAARLLRECGKGVATANLPPRVLEVTHCSGLGFLAHVRGWPSR